MKTDSLKTSINMYLVCSVWVKVTGGISPLIILLMAITTIKIPKNPMPMATSRAPVMKCIFNPEDKFLQPKNPEEISKNQT